MNDRILSGIQPTSSMHIGNYLGAVRHWVSMQDQYDTYYCIVDLHAQTIPRDPEEMRARSLELVATLLAVGIDPQRAALFIQSHVPAHAQLAWLLTCLTPLGWLRRMTQFKDKAGSKADHDALAGLLMYPVLMAADILLYRPRRVPVGEDQKQHLELTREIAQSFNARYKVDFFPLPEPYIIKQTARIMSLRDGTAKMSKSDQSAAACLMLQDSDEDLRRKIRKAKTDSDLLPETPQGLVRRPEARNLLTMVAALRGQTLEHAVAEFAGQPFAPLKDALAQEVISTLAPIRARIEALLAQPAHLKAILADGAMRADAVARETLRQVEDIIGFLPRG
ncbi:MAG: tryptophan--tRNA ligase [Pseudomonadota bacterium]